VPGGGAVPIIIFVATGRNDTQSKAIYSDSCDFATLRAFSRYQGLPNMDPTEIVSLIEAGLPQAEVSVLSDDNTHFEALIVSETFEGKRPLARHQLVYQCLGKLMGNEIHAMSIRAYTPDEWHALAES
jgi:acid stress-induced BolA-like protein IbaG/YrbA